MGLTLAATEWRPTPRSSLPPDRSVIYVLVFVQAVAAAMLFPYLLAGWRAFAARAVELWPMLVLAGVLSGSNGRQIAGAGAYIVLWLAVLTALQSAIATWLAFRLLASNPRAAADASQRSPARNSIGGVYLSEYSHAYLPAVAIAAAWAVGGPALLYLRAEYRPDAAPVPAAIGGPGYSAIQIALGSEILSHFAPLAILLAASISVRMLLRAWFSEKCRK
jgi:hypothetical protein